MIYQQTIKHDFDNNLPLHNLDNTSLKTLENRIEVPKKAENRATPLLGVYLEKSMFQIDTCTPMFIAALLTIAKT